MVHGENGVLQDIVVLQRGDLEPNGRRALEVAMGIVKEIERTLPQLSGSVASGLGRSHAEPTPLA